MQTHGDETTVDVLVVGSGAGALTAALRAAHLGGDVLVIEKGERYGGSSAMSGGCVWVPNTRFTAALGIEDSDADAMTYLRALTRGRVAEARLQAAVREGQAMVEFLESSSMMSFAAIPEYPDYYPELPGGKAGGRSLHALPFDGARLGDELYRMREPHRQMLFMNRIALTFPETRRAMHRRRGWARMLLRIAGAYCLDVAGRLRGARDRRLCLGAALVGRLRHALAERRIPLWTSTPFAGFIVENGRVAGAVARREGRERRIRARRGVIAAAGGFERNQAMRDRYLPAPSRAEWSTGNPDNTGDLIAAALALGAATDFMNDAWWGPTNPIPGKDIGIAYMFVTERAVPGSILVNRDGVRVVNESAPYSDIVRAMYETPTSEGKPSIPLQLIVDAAFRRRFALGPIMPGQSDARWQALFDEKFIVRAETIEALAKTLGLPAARLRQTIGEMNDFAAAGKDRQFHRGESKYDACWSDPRYGANPCLGPIGEPPFYAVAMYPGDIGTRGGLAVDEQARVLDGNGRPIAGLYAIGNCSAPVYGDSYPGAGATLGPAMTFGFVAANAAMARVEVQRRTAGAAHADLSLPA